MGFPDTGDHMDAAHPDELLLGLDELHAETLSECIVLEADCCLPQLEEIPDQYASAGELVRHAIDFGLSLIHILRRSGLSTALVRRAPSMRLRFQRNTFLPFSTAGMNQKS